MGADEEAGDDISKHYGLAQLLEQQRDKTCHDEYQSQVLYEGRDMGHGMGVAVVA